ncbi:MAG: sigma-54-dependent Fis family transcriptional regulator [Deltaproteobacteria bacterium]|nr:sigma-54-dependent Fis family transcriptional regulator [Deltaproteobacteria bacterium]
MFNILVVEEDVGSCHQMVQALIDSGYEAEMASNAKEAISKIERNNYDLILTQLASAKVDGYHILKKAKAKNKATIIIVITDNEESHAAFEAINRGAHGFIEKPFSSPQLILEVREALEKRSLSYDLDYLRHQQDTIYEAENIVGESPQLRMCLSTASKVAKTDFTILLTGETGVGKELIAGLIHYTSLRKNRPFIKVNCAALPEPLLESELFGHEKGAFTGAINQRIGRFEQANGGSLFLDEIGDMSLRTQAKVLRAIERKEFERVGGGRTIKVDLRFITASNKKLVKEVQEGNFREDLFYRLNVVPVTLPPLRERREDIPLLAEHFLSEIAERNGKLIRGFSPQAMDLLVRNRWKGNVRELENVVERAIIMARGDLLQPGDLPGHISDEGDAPSAGIIPGRPLSDLEREAILSTLEMTGGNRTETAKLLGISRRTLQYKLKEFKIKSDGGQKMRTFGQLLMQKIHN